MEEENLAIRTREALELVLVSGKNPRTQIHLLHKDDAGDKTYIRCHCGKNIRRATGICKPAAVFEALDRKPCPECRKAWPEELSAYFTN